MRSAAHAAPTSDAPSVIAPSSRYCAEARTTVCRARDWRNSAEFRQGDTLGEKRQHWFRAKFFQQYRLFFRFDSTAKVIILAWVNDEQTLRAYKSKTDAYMVFKGMLDDGNPPASFDVLMRDAAAAAERFEEALKAAPNQ